MLSHAGRVVLIKVVLQALPIYYMTTSQILANVLYEINGIIKRYQAFLLG